MLMFHPLGVARAVTSPFGERVHPVTHVHSFHNGVDLKARTGDRIYASHDGVVSLSDSSTGGHQIVIQHPAGLRTGYAHLSVRYVRQGQVVRRGDPIGEVGTSGRVTGPHLHFTVAVMSNGKPVWCDPMSVDYALATS